MHIAKRRSDEGNAAYLERRICCCCLVLFYSHIVQVQVIKLKIKIAFVNIKKFLMSHSSVPRSTIDISMPFYSCNNVMYVLCSYIPLHTIVFNVVSIKRTKKSLCLVVYGKIYISSRVCIEKIVITQRFQTIFNGEKESFLLQIMYGVYEVRTKAKQLVGNQIEEVLRSYIYIVLNWKREREMRNVWFCAKGKCKICIYITKCVMERVNNRHNMKINFPNIQSNIFLFIHIDCYKPQNIL